MLKEEYSKMLDKHADTNLGVPEEPYYGKLVTRVRVYTKTSTSFSLMVEVKTESSGEHKYYEVIMDYLKAELIILLDEKVVEPSAQLLGILFMSPNIDDLISVESNKGLFSHLGHSLGNMYGENVKHPIGRGIYRYLTEYPIAEPLWHATKLTYSAQRLVTAQLIADYVGSTSIAKILGLSRKQWSKQDDIAKGHLVDLILSRSTKEWAVSYTSRISSGGSRLLSVQEVIAYDKDNQDLDRLSEGVRTYKLPRWRSHGRYKDDIESRIWFSRNRKRILEGYLLDPEEFKGIDYSEGLVLVNHTTQPVIAHSENVALWFIYALNQCASTNLKGLRDSAIELIDSDIERRANRKQLDDILIPLSEKYHYELDEGLYLGIEDALTRYPLDRHVREGRPKELISYLYLAYHQQALNCRTTAYELCDYWNMTEGIKAKKYPNSLRLSHDLAQRNYKIIENKALKEKLQKQYDETYKLFHWKGREQLNGWEIVVPKEARDFAQEGAQMNNCVASYANRVANGGTLILFLRVLKKGVMKSSVTIELSTKTKGEDYTIVQCLGNSNRRLTPQQEEVVSAWIHSRKREGVTIARR